MLNYAVLANMYQYRRDHKLDEWHTFCDWIEKLPYAEFITGKMEAARCGVDDSPQGSRKPEAHDAQTAQ